MLWLRRDIPILFAPSAIMPALAAILIALAVIVLAAPAAARSPITADALREAIRDRVEALAAGQAVEAGGEPLHAVHALPALYTARGFEPVWLDDDRATAALLDELEGAEAQGLVADHYHATLLRDLVAKLATRERRAGDDEEAGLLADLELALSDAFLLYGSHVVSGRVDPESFDPEWIAVRREVDLVVALERAVEAGVAQVLRELEPDAPEYRRLIDALARYRRLAAAGGWSAIGEGELLSLEELRSERVLALRRRLAVTGDLGPTSPAISSETFDAELDLAVRAFQQRHGLEPDGKVGVKTLAELDVPVTERVSQLERNLERWRWLPQSLGEHHVRVNVPGYSLEEWRAGVPTLEMKVIAGRVYRRTPVFSGELSYLVLNPSWEVPPSLAVRDKLPLIREDVTFLERLGFEVLQGWGSDETTVDPATVDWSALGPGSFPYRLRQRPGQLNALGKVKFMFPNRFNVYLHDTPERGLFARAQRDFSSGCIRIERPLELAWNLLEGLDGWSPERLERVLASGASQTVVLAEPVPVHVLYFTAWASEDGRVHFRRDLYGRDVRLAAALASAPPG
jgi:murein L,D-transpeptidase YcbB/YkuD